jgi:hypothetical protein
VSVYGVNKVCHLTQVDLSFREAMRVNPAAAVESFPLTAEERSALLSGDVARLCEMGAHTFLLSRLPRFGSLGLDRDTYIQRMRTLLTDEERRAVEEESRLQAAIRGGTSGRTDSTADAGSAEA